MISSRDFYGRPIFLAGAPSPYAGFGPIGEYQRRQSKGFQSMPEYMEQFQRAGGQSTQGSPQTGTQTLYPPQVDIDVNTDNPDGTSNWPGGVDIDVNEGEEGGGEGEGTGEGELRTVNDGLGFPAYKVDSSGAIYDLDGNPIGPGAEAVNLPGGDAIDPGDLLGGMDFSLGGVGPGFLPNATLSIGGVPNPMLLFDDNNYVKAAGAVSLIPGIGPLASLAMLGIGDLIGIGRQTSGDRREAGRQIADPVLDTFFTKVLGRPEDEVYGVFGSSDADRAFIEGWAEKSINPLGGDDWDFLGLNYNSIYENWGSDPSGMIESLANYYGSLDPSLRPAIGDTEGWADAGVSAEDMSKSWADTYGYSDFAESYRAPRDAFDSYRSRSSAYQSQPWVQYGAPDLYSYNRWRSLNQYNPYGDYNPWGP